MLFDLEIQPNIVDVVYIKHGEPIHNSLIPISYCEIKRQNVIPSDFIEIEEDAKFTSFSTARINTVNSGADTFPVDSDKFLITHIKKYSEETGTDVPLFYKHTIALNGMTIPIESIRLFDSSGITIGQDQFYVEYFPDHICVYINPRINNILTVEYSYGDTDNTIIKSELMKLELIFKQVEYDWIIKKEDLGKFEYLYNGAIVMTKYIGARYFIYQKDHLMFKKPVASMDDSWYLRLENIQFRDNYYNLTYSMLEYTIQQLNYGQNVKRYTNVPAKIVGERYVQLQNGISINDIRSVNIYIRNLQTDTIEYMITAEPSKVGTIDTNTNKQWLQTLDYNTDGTIELPITLTMDHIATSDFTIPNIYYELRTLDLNSMDIFSSKMIGIYILPTTESQDTTMAVLYGYIGIPDASSDDEKWLKNGSGYKNKENYRAILDFNSCVHLAYVSLSTNKMMDVTNFLDARELTGGISNIDVLSKTDYDFFINDFKNGEIILPIGDALLATIDGDVMAKKQYSYESDILIEDKNSKYKEFVKNTLYKNLDISTDVTIISSGE